MNQITLSLVAPVYNVDRYLNECVDSILPQLDDHMELILVDDGSTDRSGEICDSYAKQSSNIKVIHQSNAGVSVARNRGMEIANGKWIGFIDSDDWLAPDFISTFLKNVEEDTDVFFYRHIEVIKGKKVEREKTGIKIHIGEDDFKRLIHAGFNRDLSGNIDYYKVKPATPCKIYSRDVLQKSHANFPVGLKTGEDLIFNLQVYQHASKGMYVNDALYYHRVWENSVSQKYDPKATEAYSLLQRELEKWVQRIGETEKYQTDLTDKAMLSLGFCCMLQFCHPDNPALYKNRREQFMTTRNSKIYDEACKCVNLNHFKLKKRLLFVFIKYRFFFAISCLCKLQQMI